MTQLQKVCEVFYYGMAVKILPLVDATTLQLTSRLNFNKFQYKTTDILAYLAKHKPADSFQVIAALNTDLYPLDSFNFVYGQADLINKVGVFSFARYYNSFYSGQPSSDDMDLVLYRSCKVMVHELGH